MDEDILEHVSHFDLEYEAELAFEEELEEDRERPRTADQGDEEEVLNYFVLCIHMHTLDVWQPRPFTSASPASPVADSPEVPPIDTTDSSPVTAKMQGDVLVLTGQCETLLYWH
jgi:hypothetical protein